MRRQDRTGCRDGRRIRGLPPAMRRTPGGTRGRCRRKSPRRRSRRISQSGRPLWPRHRAPSVVEASLPPISTEPTASPARRHPGCRAGNDNRIPAADADAASPPQAEPPPATVASLPSADEGHSRGAARQAGCRQGAPGGCEAAAAAAALSPRGPAPPPPARSNSRSRRPPIPSRSSSAARSPLSRPGRDRRTIGQAPFRPRAVVERAVDS